MKKLITIVLLLAVITAAFVGCRKDNTINTTPTSTEATTAEKDTTPGTTVAHDTIPVISTADVVETDPAEPATTESNLPVETDPAPETVAPTAGRDYPDDPALYSSPEEIDWAHTTITVDGVSYSTMMPFSELQKNGWDFNFEDYNIGENYVLNPGDWSAATIHLNNPERYGSEISSAEIIVGFINYSDKILPIKECDVRAIKVDGTYNSKLIDVDWESPCYDFEFILGIKRGAMEEQILAAYGAPNDISENETSGYKIYTYKSSDGMVENKLTIYKKYGLQAIEITDHNRY